MLSFKLGILGLLIGGALGIVASRAVPKQALVSPAGPKPAPSVLSAAYRREIIGFLPYWNLTSATYIPYDKLTTIYYFAIDIDGEGNINKSDGGWRKLQSAQYRYFRDRLKQYQKLRFGITFVSLDADTIARVVNSSDRQNRLIKNILQTMEDQQARDLNFDLEYSGDITDSLITGYTQLVDKISQAVHQTIPASRVSLDVYADAAAKRRIYNVAALAKSVDQVIVMGYDFHRLGSLEAGPIAPLFGQEKYNYDVYHSVVDYLKLVPNNKLVLAVPFYGYEWPTDGPQPQAAVIDSQRGPEISSYKRSLQTAADNNVSVNFDDLSKSAWFTYYDSRSGNFRQVWFENERSLGLKFDLINQAGLAGAAIWALGYDGPMAQSLWQTVSDKLLPSR